MHGSLQQDGGGGEGRGGTLSCRGRIKEQVRLERKDKKKRRENYLHAVYPSVLMQGPQRTLYMHMVVEGLVGKSALLKFKVTLKESLNYIN